MATQAVRLSTVVWTFAAALGAMQSGAREPDELWEMESLAQPPQTFDAPAYGAEDLTSLFFAGEPLAGKPTRVFAYLGLPSGADAEHPVPGVVCVHGGGGTAFAEWVRIWNRHGFAAIAMDTNGAVPEAPAENPDDFRHRWAGPRRYGFDQGNQPLRDHWNYHAVAAVILANSLLRSLPEVDAEQVGVTGISWGGYKTCIAASVDSRFQFAVPVYGCGFLRDSSTMASGINAYGTERWLQYWDPSAYLHQAALPILWLNGTNDKHFHMPPFQRSAQTSGGRSTLVIRKEMPHGHGAGWSPPEIYAFAKAAVGRGKPLIDVHAPRHQNEAAEVKYDDANRPPVVSADLLVTQDGGAWRDRRWQQVPAQVDPSAKAVSARLPAGTTAYFFNLIDERRLMVSSPYAEVD